MIDVLLGEDYFGYELKVLVVNRQEGARDTALRVLEDGRPEWKEIDPHEAVCPTFLLPYDTGRALLNALTRHYHGADDTRALRRDYDAERARVDKQGELIGDVLRTLAGVRTAS